MANGMCVLTKFASKTIGRASLFKATKLQLGSRFTVAHEASLNDLPWILF